MGEVHELFEHLDADPFCDRLLSAVDQAANQFGGFTDGVTGDRGSGIRVVLRLPARHTEARGNLTRIRPGLDPAALLALDGAISNLGGAVSSVDRKRLGQSYQITLAAEFR